MDSGETLNCQYRLYSRKAAGKKELEAAIIGQVLKHPRQYLIGYMGKDERVDFLAWVYPRLSRAVDRFRNQEAAFKTYIVSFIRFSAREFRRQEKNRRIAEHASYEAAVEESAAGGSNALHYEHDEPGGAENGAGETRLPLPGKISGPVLPFRNPRQALVLLLKSYGLITDERIRAAAPALGMEEDALRLLLEKVRELRLAQDQKIAEIREKSHYFFFRRLYYERKMADAAAGTAEKARLEGLLERIQKKLDRTKRSLKKMKTGASSRQIALALGVPKGTVDSALYRAKMSLYSAPEPLRDSLPVNPRTE
jgi:RNA polymerase sigma factor (sigma-70 family)